MKIKKRDEEGFKAVSFKYKKYSIFGGINISFQVKRGLVKEQPEAESEKVLSIYY